MTEFVVKNITPQVVPHPIEPKNWEEKADRLVLYADILGFKERIYSQDYDAIRDKLISFRTRWNDRMKTILSEEELKFVQFSDTILIIAKGTDLNMLDKMTKGACVLMQTAMEEGLPMKGVISKGPFLFNRDMELYLGKPLVDAYKLYDELYYYGIVVHHSAENTVKNDLTLYSHEMIPLKKGSTAHIHVAWNLMNEDFTPGDRTEECKKWLEAIEENVSGSPRIYVDNTRKVLKDDLEAFNKRSNEYIE